MQNLQLKYIDLRQAVELIWDNYDTTNMDEAVKIVSQVLALLDSGQIRVAEKIEQHWVVNEWIKKAILLSFRITPNQIISGGPAASHWYDKVNLKFNSWQQEDFAASGIRAVPGSIVRHGAYIAPKVILLPCFINIGAYIGEGTMVDTWSTIGSCAQIGKNCHISGGVGIGGVLEPIQGNPVIIEDNCFIGARSEVAEGAIIETGAVLSMGVFIGASTKIVDRATGEVFIGRVPPYSVVVPGSMSTSTAHGGPALHLSVAVIVKKVDAQTRSKTAINELLRDL